MRSFILNSSQRAVIIIGVILLVVILLFPPTAEVSRNWKQSDMIEGFAPVWARPRGQGVHIKYLIIELTTAVICIAAIFFSLSTRKIETGEEQNDRKK